MDGLSMPRPMPLATQIARIPLALSLSFALLAFLIHGAPPGEFDRSISRALQRYDVLELPMRIVSLPADGFIPHLLAVISVLGFLMLGWRRDALLLASTTAGSAIINGALKLWIERPRPTASEVRLRGLFEGFSFPSGHVAFFVCYFGVLALIASHRVVNLRVRGVAITLCLIPIALIPFSRVYLGAHWPSDTIGSLLWSTAFVAVAWRVYHRNPPRSPNRAPPPSS